MRKGAFLIGGMVLSGLICSGLLAAAPDPASVQKFVDAREAHYKEIGKAAKDIHDELAGSQPNLATVQANARAIEVLAKQIPTWFPAGSGPQPGVKAEALPVIWEQNALFKQRAAGLAAAAGGLAAATSSGNLEATKTASGNLFGACKACHDTFREKK